MSVFIITCLFVLAVAVLAIGVVLHGIAADVRRTRQAIENLSPHPAPIEASTVASG